MTTITDTNYTIGVWIQKWKKSQKKEKTITASYDQITRQMRTDNKSYRKKKLKKTWLSACAWS